MIDPDEVYRVSQSMKAFGGSFVKQLAVLLDHADVHNQQKIKITWSDYWKQYLDMAIVMEKK